MTGSDVARSGAGGLKGRGGLACRRTDLRKIGVFVRLVLGTPGFEIASYFGVIPPGVVKGISHLYVELFNALVWAPAYGTIGWLIDRIRIRKR